MEFMQAMKVCTYVATKAMEFLKTAARKLYRQLTRIHHTNPARLKCAGELELLRKLQ